MKIIHVMFGAKAQPCSILIIIMTSGTIMVLSATPKILNAYNAGYFMYCTHTQILSNLLADFQLLACIFLSRKQKGLRDIVISLAFIILAHRIRISEILP